MAQVILNVPLQAFYYALATNFGRRPAIREGCSTAAQIVTQVSQEFHRRNPAAYDPGQFKGIPPSRRPQWAAKLENFYSKVCHVRVAAEGNDKRGGFVVLDGELLGLHHVDKAHGDWLLAEAIKLGADRLDCFDVPHLIDLYQRHGFKEIIRESNHTKGQPDVVWMRRDV